MVTIKDVAKAAGVSIATVSYVLNKDPRIKKETAEKVLKVSEELNYVASGFARSLKTNKTRIVLTVIPDFGGPIHAEIIANIHKELKNNNYQMLVCAGDIAEEVLSKQLTDGVIVLDPKVSSDVLKRIAKTRIKVVDTRKIYDENDGIFVSRIDFAKPVKELTKTIIAEGYSKIGYMHGHIESPDNIRRFNGFSEALKEKNLEPFCILNGNFIEEEASIAIKEYLEKGNELPEVLFCANDEMGIGVIKTLNELGYNLPKDIKIIGFDDIAACNYVNPTLTSISFNRSEWARGLAQVMVNLIENKPVDSSKFIPNYTIIRRNSF